MELFKRILQPNFSVEEQFDDESVFYINDSGLRPTSFSRHESCPTPSPCFTPENIPKQKKNVQKITDNSDITPIITPDIYTTNGTSPDIHKKNPLRMPDGQIDPYVFWLKDEKRYLFTEGRLILTENNPTYAIPTDFCHTDSSQKKHRIMIYYDINKSFEKRFGYYDSSNCFCEVEYIPEFAFIH